MAQDPFDRLKQAVTGTITLGRSVAGQAIGIAVPVVTQAARLVQDKVSDLRGETPPTAPPAPTDVEVEDPVAEPAVKQAAKPDVKPAVKQAAKPRAKAATKPASRSGGPVIPTPAEVAPRVAKHDPANDILPPADPAPKPSEVPGAKLPPPRP